MYDVFISYRRKGGFLLAQVLHDYLAKNGIKAFLDFENLNNGKFMDKIKKAIDDAPNFILVVATGTLERCIEDKNDPIVEEVEYAFNNSQKKNFIPVFFDYSPSPEMIEKLPVSIREVLANNGVTECDEYLKPMIEKVIRLMVDVDIKTINFATSTLTVIDSLLQGFDDSIFERYRCRLEKIPYEWNDKILDDLKNGKIDMAIYNRESTLKYNETHGNSIHIIKDVCSSMGGRNFYVLAHKDSKWKGLNLEDFKKEIKKGTFISVAENSDRFKNLLYILDMTKEEFFNTGVKIINQSETPSLDIFELNLDVLLIGGQDIRYVADKRGDFIEIISYDDFPSDKKEFFYKNSINSLLIGESGCKKLEGARLDVIAADLMSCFYKNAMTEDSFEMIKYRLAYNNNSKYSEDESNHVLKRILFETYRLM